MEFGTKTQCDLQENYKKLFLNIYEFEILNHKLKLFRKYKFLRKQLIMINLYNQLWNIL